MNDAAVGLVVEPPIGYRCAMPPTRRWTDRTWRRRRFRLAIYEKCGQITSWGSALCCWAPMAHGLAMSFGGGGGL